MLELKIVVSCYCLDCFFIYCNIVNVDESCFIDVVVIVLFIDDIEYGKFDEIDVMGYGIFVFVVIYDEGCVLFEYLLCIFGVFEYNEFCIVFYGCQLEIVVSYYEMQLCLLFFCVLVDYVNQGNSVFDCLGYQGGEFFCCYFVGNQFVEYFGEMFFCFDLCNVDVVMGDLLIYEGVFCIVQ